MRNIRRIQALKVIVFCLLLCVTLGIVAIPFTNPHDYRAYEWARSLGEERKGALDVVFIGSSNTYAFYAPLLAWKYFGVAAHTYAFSSQKPEAFKYMIEEARKTQPDAVYVISLGNVSLDNEIESVHYLTDWMPCSLNRLRLLLAYFKYNDYSVYEQTELLFPFSATIPAGRCWKAQILRNRPLSPREAVIIFRSCSCRRTSPHPSAWSQTGAN